jgi:hypothetical protein
VFASPYSSSPKLLEERWLNYVFIWSKGSSLLNSSKQQKKAQAQRTKIVTRRKTQISLRSVSFS